MEERSVKPGLLFLFCNFPQKAEGATSVNRSPFWVVIYSILGESYNLKCQLPHLLVNVRIQQNHPQSAMVSRQHDGDRPASFATIGQAACHHSSYAKNAPCGKPLSRLSINIWLGASADSSFNNTNTHINSSSIFWANS
ncbi:hypothetical protein QE417_002461 [Mucilaginibacter terrae]|uniref:Uncharacterized protein n=1 Tax=Mucilaginibacter terrae TaxID=1955052 RepID=A0ABU3GUE6_9SPHI|nr:hypothetical protein [Mucilaginibacter terrae]